MTTPLSFLNASNCEVPPTSSLGEFLGETLSKSSVRTLVDCLCSGSNPAVYSPDEDRLPLLHESLRGFISSFVLPHSRHRKPLGRNDRIMVVLPTGPENAVALLALGCYHACAPVNSNCTAVELKDYALRLGAKAIIATEDVANRLQIQTFLEELDCEIIYLHPRMTGPAGLFDLSVPRECGAVLSSSPTAANGLDDISLILHTSGTSGKQKVVRYSLRTILIGTLCVVRSWDLVVSDVNLNMMPLFHVGGIVRNLLAPILSGGSTIVCLGFDPNMFWPLAIKLKATWYYAAPTVHHAILAVRSDNVVGSRDTCIRMICNAAGGLLPSLAMDLKDTFGAVVLPSYGMTECMPIATPPQDYNLDRPGCSGLACGPYLSIREASNIECAAETGKTGAVCVRGLPTFDGYEVSSDISVPLDISMFSNDGWYDSGDVGYVDEDGYLYITGRSKEIINKGGEVISPYEVEEAIMVVAKEWLKTVLAFSVEHDVLQETIGIVVVSASNKPRLCLQQLHDLLNGHLHASKWPFAIAYMEDLPKNSAGKPLRIGLSKRLGLGKLTDNDAFLHRHYEASLPDNPASISEPIPCRRVIVDFVLLENALRSVPDVADIALRSQPNGTIHAYLSVQPGTNILIANVIEHVSQLLPGYALPRSINLVYGSLLRNSSGDYDFSGMEKAPARNMSSQQLLVRGVIAEILNLDPQIISQDSDFFLLGGNSLLLGKLSYQLRKQSGTSLAVAELFANSTIQGIAALLDGRRKPKREDSFREDDFKSDDTAHSSTTTFSLDYDFEQDLEYSLNNRSRGQNHPLCLIVQAVPFLLFYPLKISMTWAMLLYLLSCLSILTNGNYWDRMVALITSVIAARLLSRLLCPLVAIAFKWIVIGRYKPGTYRMWSVYYLRWWIVNQSLRIAGRGIFAVHPSLTVLYYRLLGAKIGQDVHIDEDTRLFECDLVSLQDGCRLDSSCVRAFCVETEGYFKLTPIIIGRKSFINSYTFISPGSTIPDGAVYGPHASSFDEPSQKSFAAYNRTVILKPHLYLRILVAWPVIILIIFVSYIPWMLAIFCMINETHIAKTGLNETEAVIHWFADTHRIIFHTLSRVVRALFQPLIQVALGILLKRVMGLNKESATMNPSQISLLRRYINSILLSRSALKGAFSILGSHYELVSVIYRLMGAKVGKHIYWPGSGFYCPDPELMDVGDDVVFGSRSSLVTTDRLGSGKIIVERGAMIADRVVLLPGTRVGARAVMGSGALGKRNAAYAPGSTWIGNENGQAICFSQGDKETNLDEDATTPFGKAFYKREATYFVYPYFFILFLSIIVTAASSAYWSVSAVGAARILQMVQLHLPNLRLFRSGWYGFGVLYGLVGVCFIIIVSMQGVAAILWVIFTKWLVIRQRREGRYDWDQSSYCQRWQLHLTLSRVAYKGYGNGGVLAPFAGTAYLVWFYRALGAKIGKNCGIWAGGKPGLMTEPDLVELGDEVNLDDCSVVAHLNSRGRFSLNKLKLGHGSAMRAGARLLSGASMEDNSMLLEHTLLTSGEVADAGVSYAGWPGKRLEDRQSESETKESEDVSRPATLTCPICRRFPKDSTVSDCGHLFCQPCIARSLSSRKYCPVCFEPSTANQLKKVHLSFSVES